MLLQAVVMCTGWRVAPLELGEIPRKIGGDVGGGSEHQFLTFLGSLNLK